MSFEYLPRTHYMIGCMSGTSLDGIDLVYVKFVYDKSWTFEIMACHTHVYSEEWIGHLAQAIHLDPKALQELDLRYTQFLGGVVRGFIASHGIVQLDAVSSHGHTIFHQPEKGITFQLGNLSLLAEEVGCDVVCDFRVQDVALGGQGAPLVPIGDVFLFDQYRACLNLGGFSNLSLVDGKSILAYDICAVNTVLNHFSQQLGLPYDDEGKLAREGKIILPLLNAFKKINFYNQPPPKSLGMEWVEREIFTLTDRYSDRTVSDLLHTYTFHIADEMAKCMPLKGSVLVTGGGAYNTFLIEQLQERSSSKMVLPKREIIDFKEALIFAFLGVLRKLGQVNCLSSVTGASRDHSSGKIFVSKSEN